jgi:hypothetical protein
MAGDSSEKTDAPVGLQKPVVPEISVFDKVANDGEPWPQDGDPTQELDESDILEEQEFVLVGEDGQPIDQEPRVDLKTDIPPAPRTTPQARAARLPRPTGEPASVSTTVATAMTEQETRPPTGENTNVEEAAESQDHFARGMALRDDNRPQAAIDALTEALNQGSRGVPCHRTIGLCYRDLGNANRAISSFKNALFQEDVTADETKELHYELGSTHEREEEWEEALYYYRRVVKVDPTFKDAAIRIKGIERLIAKQGGQA